ncbi:response regulator transcription factor [Fodinisporobacter ferrooxydans]|uniref:Response regulator transcription factor n=1 Tax=Fodinisporobacter ferrooxydans TaxID=2901836 RepID=A0ABY4CN46_9BACL|nr:response regulator transcription factor [Alicyclobacillaceae bacterium MYW30-H2]
MANRVLVVDDEESIVKLITYTFQQAGFEVFTADNGKQGMEIVKQEQPDLIILDLMLPEIDGMELCRRMRKEGINVPIIMLTAKDDEIDRVLGLEMGADDYVTKPFSPRELVARVKAVLRRSGDTEANVKNGILKCGDIVVDANKYEVMAYGKHIELTPREFELLLYLAKNMGRVLSRDLLLDKVWGYEFAGDTRIVDVHISHLRDKVERDPRNPIFIKTVRGVGYKLVEHE